MSRTRAAAVLAGALAACGVKAPPRPPERHAPGAHPEPATIPTTAETCDSCANPTSNSTARPGVERAADRRTIPPTADVSRVVSRPAARDDGAE